MAVYEIDNIPAKIDFSGADTAGRIAQNVKNLLCCMAGEIPYDRQRGFNTALFDLPAERLREMLPQEIERLMLWEPRAEVLSADIDTGSGETVIRIRVSIDPSNWEA